VNTLAAWALVGALLAIAVYCAAAGLHHILGGEE
jgi:hypothetical protein